MNGTPQEHPIKLVVADPVGLFRASLSRFLSANSGIEVIGECATAEEALEVLARSPVDLVLMDFDMRTEQGGELIPTARQAGYPGRFLIVAGALDVRKSATALKQGASGIFLKSETPERLIEAIRLVANGELWVDAKVIHLLADQSLNRYARLANQSSANDLDDRERDVLLGIVGGMSNRRIADHMGLSESSIKNVIQKLFARTAVRTRGQLVRLALEGSFDGARKFLANQAGDMIESQKT